MSLFQASVVVVLFEKAGIRVGIKKNNLNQTDQVFLLNIKLNKLFP